MISLRKSSQVIECNCAISYLTKLLCNFCIPSKDSVKPGGLPGQNHHLIEPFQILGFKSPVRSDEIQIKFKDFKNLFFNRFRTCLFFFVNAKTVYTQP